jgi:hypothetical protein
MRIPGTSEVAPSIGNGGHQIKIGHARTVSRLKKVIAFKNKTNYSLKVDHESDQTKKV